MSISSILGTELGDGGKWERWFRGKQDRSGSYVDET